MQYTRPSFPDYQGRPRFEASASPSFIIAHAQTSPTLHLLCMRKPAPPFIYCAFANQPHPSFTVHAQISPSLYLLCMRKQAPPFIYSACANQPHLICTDDRINISGHFPKCRDNQLALEVSNAHLKIIADSIDNWL